jgi:transmembrane sensor
MSSDTPGRGNVEGQTDWDALARYLAGESSAEECENVRQWLASRPADAVMVGALDDALARLTLGPDSMAGIDVEGALGRVKARRAHDAPLAVTGVLLTIDRGKKLSFPDARRTRWMPLAAAAALVLAIGALVWRGRTASDDRSTVAARTFTTGVGGRDSLQLSDGTSIVLGPGSRLTLAAGYGQPNRSVALEGEAYFDVAHDAARPFVITVDGATIRDIGTAFAVHADSMGVVRVAVKSGTVALNTPTSPSSPATTLHAGDVGVVATSGEIVAQRGAATDDDLAWTRGTLIFRDATIAEVRDDLRRWYGIELVATEAVLRRHLTATFSNRDSVGSVLRNIGLSLPATIERHGDTAIVRPAPEARQRK